MSDAIFPALGAYLQAQGVGTLASTLFLGRFPAEAATGILLVETAGTATTPVRGDALLRVQVTSRHSDYPTARAKAWQVYHLLNVPEGPINLSGSTWVLDAKAVQTPFSLGLDEFELWRVVFNVQLQTPAR